MFLQHFYFKITDSLSVFLYKNKKQLIKFDETFSEFNFLFAI